MIKDNNLNSLNANKIISNSLTTNSLNVNESFTLIRSPAFLAYLTSTQSNKTGQGESYFLGTNGTLTIAFNRGMQINSSGLFTCLYDGIYNIGVNIQSKGIDDVTIPLTIFFNVYNGNTLIDTYTTKILANSNPAEYTTYPANTLINLSKGNTIKIELFVLGLAGTTVDFVAIGSKYGTTFYGFMV